MINALPPNYLILVIHVYPFPPLLPSPFFPPSFPSPLHFSLTLISMTIHQPQTVHLSSQPTTRVVEMIKLNLTSTSCLAKNTRMKLPTHPSLSLCVAAVLDDIFQFIKYSHNELTYSKVTTTYFSLSLELTHSKVTEW